MQQFRLIKKIVLTIVSISAIGSVYADSIGDIIESTGLGSLTRNNETIQSAVNTKVNLYDRAETTNGRMLIEFLDKAELALTEHTRVLIDEVIYDPNPDKSKMVMKMAFGTARFASGGGISKQNIDISTPTAQIAVRGTNFTTTIDELGRSLVILLPDEYGDPSGIIIVSNQAGEVTLDQAYAATMVSSLDSKPTQSVVINGITPAIIDNMFIVNPPQEIRQEIEEGLNENQDSGILDVDFLEFNELEADALKDTEVNLEYSELDIDFLEADFLRDLLDVIEELEATTVKLVDQQATTSVGGVRLSGATLGKNNDSQYNIFVEDGGLVFYRDVQGVIRIKVPIDSSTKLITSVEGYEGTIDLEGGSDSIIVITQE
jgi:hypothetical protein|tara:strand:- start:557 stop:1681 length:1125 start_codon:yes stop_codon:yes gene_type:complete